MPSNTAIDTYRERIALTRAAIVTLEEVLNDHEEGATQVPRSWSWSGDLQRINEGLADLLEPFGIAPEYLARLRS